MQELIAAAKAKPGALNYASAGVGTANQLNAERFRIGAGIDAVHVPFKGTPEALTEVLAGRVDYYFCPVNVCLPMIREKRLLALGMGSSKRSAALPDLPTTLELGVPNSDYNFWVGMFVPAEHAARDRRTSSMPRRGRRSRVPKLKDGCRPARRRGRAGRAQDAYNLQLKKEIADNAALVKASGIPINGVTVVGRNDDGWRHISRAACALARRS